MKKISSIKWLLALCAGYLLTGCGIHYTIKGQVVDIATRQPVQGAVVAIHWERSHFITVPGLPVDSTEYGTSESVTDADGAFCIPKYLIGEHKLVAYKRGYVCWNSDVIYNPHGDNIGIPYYERKVENGMRIELVPINEKDFLELDHARFTVTSVGYLFGARLIGDAIVNEKRIVKRDGKIKRLKMLEDQRKAIEQRRKREMRK